MKTTDAVDYLNKALKSVKPGDSGIEKSDFLKYNSGAVWETVSENPEFPFVMILENEGNETYNVAPVFRWTESAGPEDLFLPSNFMGTPMVISFEVKFSLTKNKLKSYKGTLKAEYFDFIIESMKSLENGTESEKFTWGFPYLNKYDARCHYHKELAAEIEKLRKKSPMIIPFPSFRSLPGDINTIAAAGTDETSVSKEYTLADMPEITVRFTRLKDSSECLIEVFDDAGNPSDRLNGYTFLDNNDKKIGVISNSSLVVNIRNLINGAAVNSPEGKALTFEEKQ